ncbi:phage integrase central domain-containing protein [Sphingomonas sp. LaA6.9]|uniref:tyrosine-type recombinase/integrase n=1 Tax=Sphingomonas sp. LaA6.9 TaxID=2919914 RepID=UPI001F4F72CC|nr:integrase arm-type DNA-binding domain-containing protein [Sphingomonas sp. LaA6.9]MCJ8158546.1 integrase arm-type DNA-binding domain-containing protein [Sphingomonas sp. LaA6.9]
MGKLTATAIKAAKKPGRYGDGDGLFLVVNKSGAASWVVRAQKAGKRRDIGLGSAKKVSLARARQLAESARTQIEAGLDPVAERKKAEGIPTFRQAAALVHAEHKKAWRNSKHGAQWLSTLETYAFPTVGDLPVNAVDGPAVRDLLAAIWLEKNETARRVRQRIGAIVDWAVGKGYRDAALPMAVINRALPKVTSKGGHHAALPYSELPAFIVRLHERETWGRLALEAAILTAARSGEIRGATWAEVDLEAGLWTVPPERMKAGKPHVVPLSPAAKRVFERAAALNTVRAKFIFEGAKPDKPMSDMTLMKVLRDMGESCTAHGFRSTFRDWVSEQTNFPGAIAEPALAHAIENKTEAAYRRGNLLEKRRGMMNAWSDYCDGGRGKVVRLATANKG